jgi:TP901 family phage tail tape measure protein
MKVLEANVRAAKGGFTDTAVTVKATVGLLNAYGLSADKADFITNIMAKTVKQGVLTFEEMAANIGTVSAIAAVLGVDFEALAASISTITRAGVPVEITMTALRAILSTFKTPTKEAIEAAQQLGLPQQTAASRAAG